MTLRNLVALILLAGALHAQIVIPGGTKVTARLEETLSSATAQEGQSVNLSVTEDVRINGVVAIPQGAAVVGTVILAKERGRMGKAGKLDFSIDKVRAADGAFIPLRYSPYKKHGEGKTITTGILTGAAVVAFWPAAPLFLLMKGKDTTLQRGLSVNVFTDADHALNGTPLAAAENGTGHLVFTSADPQMRGIVVPAQERMSAVQMTPAAQQTDSTMGRVAFHSAGARPTTREELVPVTVDSDVDGAEVEVDGSYVGNTPATRRLAPGNHRVTVRDGAQVWERILNVQLGDSITVKAKLTGSSGVSKAARR